MKPNVVLISGHDLGRLLSVYNRDIETPELDKLSEGGVTFENNFATASQCSPSRASIMTGKYPHNHGLMGLVHEGYGWKLNEDEKTIPNYLNESGYETHLFGLQHESKNPSDLGYQYIHGEGIGSQRAKPTTKDFLNFLDSWEDNNSPFFASIGFYEAHRPYGLEKYEDVKPSEISPLPYLPDTKKIRDDLAGLYSMIHRVDESVGIIMKKLSGTGIKENTLVIFTTDHGIAMPRAKGTCYDPGVGTALVMSDSEVFSTGNRYEELISNIDLLPTLLDYLEIEIPQRIDGKSFYPLVKGNNYQSRNHIFMEMTWHDKYNPLRAIRTERYKYIKNFVDEPGIYLPADIYDSPSGEEVKDKYYSFPRPDEELYDLQSDPWEKNNLAELSTQDDVKKELKDKLIDWMEETNDPLLNGPVPPTEEQKQTLKNDQLGN